MTDAAQLVLAVIPARGGSKGLLGKNIRTFLGMPLIGHSIRFAEMCERINRCIISTDSAQIRLVANELGGDIPFMRPRELATADTPMWPVLRHALSQVEKMESRNYDFLVLLDPTSPGRPSDDIDLALKKLRANPDADGIVGVSRPEFNPMWVCIVEQENWMTSLVQDGERFERRQDVPSVYRINGALYIWRTPFVRKHENSWREGKHLIYEIPESRAMSIDTIEQFAKAEALVRAGLIKLPSLP